MRKINGSCRNVQGCKCKNDFFWLSHPQLHRYSTYNRKNVFNFCSFIYCVHLFVAMFRLFFPQVFPCALLIDEKKVYDNVFAHSPSPQTPLSGDWYQTSPSLLIILRYKPKKIEFLLSLSSLSLSNSYSSHWEKYQSLDLC